MVYFQELEGSRAKCTVSKQEERPFTVITHSCYSNDEPNPQLCLCLCRTCTIEFSGIGVTVLKVFLICSTQRGTYFSNRMVRWALSVWCSLWSIQLATYLSNKPESASFEWNASTQIYTWNNLREAGHTVLFNHFGARNTTNNTEDKAKN